MIVIPACDGMTATDSDQGEGWRMGVAPFIRAGRMYAWGAQGGTATYRSVVFSVIPADEHRADTYELLGVG